MSHIKPVAPKPGFDENGIYLHHYDPSYLDRYAHLTEEQREAQMNAAQEADDFRNECKQGGR